MATTERIGFHPGEVGFAALFEDETGVGREPAAIEALVGELKAAGERHGFKLRTWGPRPVVERQLVRARLNEFVERLTAPSNE